MQYLEYVYYMCIYIYYIYMNYWKAPEKYEPTIPGRPGRRPHPGRPYSLSGCRPLFGGEPIQIYIYNICILWTFIRSCAFPFFWRGREVVSTIYNNLYLYIYRDIYIYIMYMSICVEPTYWDTVWLLSIAYFGCNRITSKQNCHRNNHRDMTGNEMYNQQRGDMTGTYM
jgi:hypothetical protein